MKDSANVASTTEVQELGFGQGVSGGPGIIQSFTRQEDGGWSEVKEFEHTFVKAIGPGTEYHCSRVETNYEIKLCFSYDLGASLIPFNHIKAACAPEHTNPYMERANSFRLLRHSVTCYDLIVMRNEIQADGRIVSTPQVDDKFT